MSGGIVAIRERTQRSPWLGFLLRSWILLQIADLITTYYGLCRPNVVEANPVMATVISLPFLTIAIKLGMTFGAAAVLRYLEQRRRVSCLPMLVALNALMLFVLINNSSVIASSGAIALPRLVSALTAG